MKYANLINPLRARICTTFKYKMFKIHFWVYKAPRNSLQLHFLSNGFSARESSSRK